MKKRRTRGQIAAELKAIYDKSGVLKPAAVVRWARQHPESALHGSFVWDDTVAGEKYRQWQARRLIVHVQVIYPDRKIRQVYVSPVEQRIAGGYSTLVEVMNDVDKRRLFLQQALAEYTRLGEKYQDLAELAGVRDAVSRVVMKARRKQNHAGRKPETNNGTRQARL